MSRIAIIGAYGAVGSVVAEVLRRRVDADLFVGGRDLARAEALAAGLGGAVSCAKVDVFDDASLRAFVDGADVVVNCVSPGSVVGDRVARFAVAMGCHYVDLGLDVAGAIRMRSKWQEPRERGRIVVLDAGWIPGLTGVLAAHLHGRALREFGAVDSVELIWGEASTWSEGASADLLAMLYSPSLMGFYDRGRWKVAASLLKAGRRELPDPFGRRMTMPAFMPDLKPLAAVTDGAVLSLCAPLLSPRQTVLMMAASAVYPVSHRRGARIFRRASQRRPHRSPSGGFIDVRVSGRQDGELQTLRASIVKARNHLVTALPCALAAEMILDRRIDRAGVQYLSEAADPSVFLDELRDEGVAVNTR